MTHINRVVLAMIDLSLSPDEVSQATGYGHREVMEVLEKLEMRGFVKKTRNGWKVVDDHGKIKEK
jgi:hypothetical protein